MARSGGTGGSGPPEPVETAEEELRQVLVGSALFGEAGWDDEVLADVVAGLTTTVARSGDVVVREGEPSDDLLLVVLGRLRVVRSSAAGERTTVAEVGRGETVGEIGLITGEPRSATVYAIRDSILARLTRERFDLLCRRHPRVMMERFAGGMLRRLLREARGDLPQHGGFRGAIALVPTAAEAGSWRWFADGLVRELGLQGAAVAVTRASCDRLLGRDGACARRLSAEEEASVARWLGAYEQEHRFVLYEADGGPAWSRRCVRQADHVVVLAPGGGEPRLDALAAIQGGDAVERKLSLVLLHEDGVIRPGAAAAWSSATSIGQVHHVRVGDERDLARVSRLLAGAATALVIGGGGARAFAGAGVARALHEAAVPVDVVAGVSAGAVVAALLAMGLPYEELITRCGAVARPVDYTIPVHALTSGRNWSAALATLFGDTTIEDLLLPYFCTSVNLSLAELVVHESGSLLHAVRSSTAIPGILPPVWHDGDLLVDGGLLNNLPIDLAHGRDGVGRVLAVNVTPPASDDPREPFGYHVSGWRALAGRLTGRGSTDLPTAVNLLMQAMLVSDAKTKRMNSRLADWLFEPALAGYSLMDWQHIAAIAETGYRYAAETLGDGSLRAAVLGEPVS